MSSIQLVCYTLREGFFYLRTQVRWIRISRVDKKQNTHTHTAPQTSHFEKFTLRRESHHTREIHAGVVDVALMRDRCEDSVSLLFEAAAAWLCGDFYQKNRTRRKHTQNKYSCVHALGNVPSHARATFLMLTKLTISIAYNRHHMKQWVYMYTCV